MSDVTDQLATAEEALTTAQTAVGQAVSDLNSEAPSTADSVLSAVVSTVSTAGLVEVFGADALTSALEEAGYTVTPPAPAAPAE